MTADLSDHVWSVDQRLRYRPQRGGARSRGPDARAARCAAWGDRRHGQGLWAVCCVIPGSGQYPTGADGAICVIADAMVPPISGDRSRETGMMRTSSTVTAGRQAELRQIAERYFDALAKHDVAEVPWDDSVILHAPLAPGGYDAPIVGKAAVQAYFASLYTTNVASSRHDNTILCKL